jgi:hypothetical protein
VERRRRGGAAVVAWTRGGEDGDGASLARERGRGEEGIARGGAVTSPEVGKGRHGEKGRLGLQRLVFLGCQTTEGFDPGSKWTWGVGLGKTGGTLWDFCSQRGP